MPKDFRIIELAVAHTLHVKGGEKLSLAAGRKVVVWEEPYTTSEVPTDPTKLIAGIVVTLPNGDVVDYAKGKNSFDAKVGELLIVDVLLFDVSKRAYAAVIGGHGAPNRLFVSIEGSGVEVPNLAVISAGRIFDYTLRYSVVFSTPGNFGLWGCLRTDPTNPARTTKTQMIARVTG